MGAIRLSSSFVHYSLIPLVTGTGPTHRTCQWDFFFFSLCTHTHLGFLSLPFGILRQDLVEMVFLALTPFLLILQTHRLSYYPRHSVDACKVGLLLTTH